MPVPKNRRKESKFEVSHNYYILRDEVTKLLLNNFGYSQEKYGKNIEHFRQSHQHLPNVDEVVERMRLKNEAMQNWFIEEERRAVFDLVRNIGTEFTIGNSIFPSDTIAKEQEYIERRHHMDMAISYCFALKQEIQDVIRILPVDMNKFMRFSEIIDKQIALIKGVRQADNRFIKPKNKGKNNENNKGNPHE